MKIELFVPTQKVSGAEETQSSETLVIHGPCMSQRAVALHRSVQRSQLCRWAEATSPTSLQCQGCFSPVTPEVPLWEDQDQPQRQALEKSPRQLVAGVELQIPKSILDSWNSASSRKESTLHSVEPATLGHPLYYL